MFIKKSVFFIFLFLYFNFLYSQNINGTVKDSNGIAIENASISVWNSEEKQTLFGYCYTNQNGDFSYKLNDKISETFIEVSCINYEKTSKKVNDITSKIIFILQNKELELEEIKIVNEKAVRVKNDSVFYDPKKFLNGTERKVEDLLKKLPGITVNESTGQIKYKGKNVETVKLEGDDLFGSNYTMGTKNISVDMVEQVQAIDNYSSNPLLKGIEETDKVVLNLKLKKGKTDYSGSATINNGYGNKVFFADDITLLGISKKIKSFGIASYNNFGIDINNFEPNSDEINSTRFSNEDFFTKKNLLESVSNTFLPASKTNFNNTFFTNFNLIYKINSKISIKNNFYYFNDKLELNESTSTKYFLANNQIIENNTENKFFRNPNYFRADTKLIYNTSKISLLQIDFSVKEQVVNSSLSTIQNFENQFNSKLKTTDFFIKLKVEYTLKLTDKTALQFNSFLSKNDIPQELVFSPSNNFITGVNAFKTIQNSNFEKQVISNRFTYLFSKGKIKSAFTFGHIYTYQPFNSKLNESDTFNSEYQNDLIYKKSNLFMEYSSVFKFRNIKIQPFVSISDYQQNLNTILDLKVKRNDFAFNYFLIATYLLNNRSSLFAMSELENKTPNEDYLFTNKIILNNTTVKNNILSLNLMKSSSTTIGYKFEDLFKQFTFKLNFQYLNNSNTFLTNILVNPNFITFTNFQNSSNIETRKINLVFEKLITDLKLTIKNSSTFGISNYKNAIDNFQLRDNKSTNFENNLYVSTFFNFLINLENKLNYSISKFESNGFSSERKSLNNTLKVIIKPFENWIFSLTHDYYVTDLKSNNNFSFLDFNLQYKSPTVKWLSFNFYGKNISNIKSFNQANNSDYFFSLYQSQLLPRHFLISMNLDF